VVDTSTYDLVVIGGGTAGLVCAVGGASLGARVALAERDRLGGECLHTGCVPSKALLGAARDGADFSTAMSRVRRAIAAIEPHDSASRLASLGVDVFSGSVEFGSPREAVVGERRLRFRRAVIATGSRPAVPRIPGLSSVPYLTNESLFSISEQPRALAVLGGGPMGCEMAQAFVRLGTHVTLIESSARLLTRDDADAASVVAKRLQDDGVTVLTGTEVTGVAREGGSIVLAHAAGMVTVDAVLLATGRVPNTEQLRLDAARVEADARGIRVDDYLRTTNPRVYASGDVCPGPHFTHAADAISRIVVENALFFRRRRASRLLIPWCTFTTPEVAHVGMAAVDAEASGCRSITVPLADVDRAVIEGDTTGFVRIHHRAGRIRGATIVGPHAGEIIGAIAVLMTRGGTLSDLASIVFPYPTTSTALRQAGDAFRREALTPRIRAMLRAYFGLRR
jgi:pyruvate/2-oxoglutarate dehydrogenase complex dihydrolipoamide dehydrogenase (E3) component